MSVESRDRFRLVGTSNGSFAFTLFWDKIDIARIDSSPIHRQKKAAPGYERGDIVGPHVHFFVEGWGLKHAEKTDAFSQDDVNDALSFFLRHCNVVNATGIQEVLTL